MRINGMQSMFLNCFSLPCYRYGIIRDILQNHLLQVMTLLTCEPPTTLEGEGAGNAIRDAKVHVLRSMPEIELEDCVLGQYDGYSDDDTIQNKDTNCPTYAALKCFIHIFVFNKFPF